VSEAAYRRHEEGLGAPDGHRGGQRQADPLEESHVPGVHPPQPPGVESRREHHDVHGSEGGHPQANQEVRVRGPLLSEEPRPVAQGADAAGQRPQLDLLRIPSNPSPPRGIAQSGLLHPLGSLEDVLRDPDAGGTAEAVHLEAYLGHPVLPHGHRNSIPVPSLLFGTGRERLTFLIVGFEARPLDDGGGHLAPGTAEDVLRALYRCAAVGAAGNRNRPVALLGLRPVLVVRGWDIARHSLANVLRCYRRGQRHQPPSRPGR